MPGQLTGRRRGAGDDPEPKKGGLIGEAQKRVQPVVDALDRMKPVLEENTRAIKELVEVLRSRP